MEANSGENILTAHLIGYVRVSTLDQSPQLQIDAQLAAGVAKEDIYHEKASSSGKRY